MQGRHWTVGLLLLALSAGAATVPVRVQAPSSELAATFSAMLVDAGVTVESVPEDGVFEVALAQFQPAAEGAHIWAAIPYRTLTATDVSCACAGITLEPHPADQLNLLHALLPRVKRVGVIAHADSRWQAQMLAPVAERLGIALKVTYLEDAAGLPRALSELLPRVGALLLLPDERLFNSATARHLLQTSYRQRRPVIGPDAGFVKAGALASVYPSLEGYAEQIAMLLAAVPDHEQLKIHFPFPAVQVNAHVARNFGIVIDDVEGLPQQLEDSR